MDQALDDSRHLGAVLDDHDLCEGREGVEEVSHLVVLNCSAQKYQQQVILDVISLLLSLSLFVVLKTTLDFHYDLLY